MNDNAEIMSVQRVLRVSVNENHDGVPGLEQTWAYGHLIHCLNVLRESVMCNADDTPLYTGHLHAKAKSSHPKAGIGTIKMCRDWSSLLQWSRERSACYNPTLNDINIVRTDPGHGNATRCSLRV